MKVIKPETTTIGSPCPTYKMYPRDNLMSNRLVGKLKGNWAHAIDEHANIS